MLAQSIQTQTKGLSVNEKLSSQEKALGYGSPVASEGVLTCAFIKWTRLRCSYVVMAEGEAVYKACSSDVTA